LLLRLTRSYPTVEGMEILDKFYKEWVVVVLLVVVGRLCVWFVVGCKIRWLFVETSGWCSIDLFLFFWVLVYFFFFVSLTLDLW
jgi:hypothetical protein